MSDEHQVEALDTSRGGQSPTLQSEAQESGANRSKNVFENIKIGRGSLNCMVSTEGMSWRTGDVQIEEDATNLMGQMNDQSIQCLRAGRDGQYTRTESHDTQSAATKTGAENSNFQKYGPAKRLTSMTAWS
jgi:hypothetical protein